MTQTSIDQNSASQYAVLACFYYDDGTEARYARWSDDITVDGTLFLSEPTLEVKLGMRHGGLDDKPTTLKINAEVAPFDVAANGFAHSPINVVIYQVDPSDPDNTARRMFEGYISEITKNVQGTNSLVSCSIPSKKKMLDIPLGLFTTPSCQWRFGDPQTCKATRPEFTATVVSVSDPTNVSLEIDYGGGGGGGFGTGTDNDLSGTERPDDFEDPLGAGSQFTNQYRRGFVEIDNLRIMIRAVRSDTVVELVRVPPPRWVGQQIRCVAGCDKQFTTCRDVWDNTENFMGPGLTIPAYNPLFAQE